MVEHEAESPAEDIERRLPRAHRLPDRRRTEEERETALALSGVRSRLLYGVDLSLRRGATVDELLHHEREVTATEATQMRKRLDRYLNGIEFEGERPAVSLRRLRLVAFVQNDQTKEVLQAVQVPVEGK